MAKKNMNVAAVEPKEPVYAVAAIRVNIRKQAKIESPVISVLEKDEKIELVSSEPKNGFYQTIKGYVMQEYLKIKE